MAEILFKPTRKKHDAGYRQLDKAGDLQYDFDPNASDGIWLITKSKPGKRLTVDCNYKNTGVISLKFPDDMFTLVNDKIIDIKSTNGNITRVPS